MTTLTHIHPRLTPEDIILRSINDYYRQKFAECEEDEDRGSPHRYDDHVGQLGWRQE